MSSSDRVEGINVPINVTFVPVKGDNLLGRAGLRGI